MKPELVPPQITRAAMIEEYDVMMARIGPLLKNVTPPFGAAIVEIDPGRAIRLHAHTEHEFYFVFSGTGSMVVGEAEYAVTPGSLVYIPPQSEHSLRATTEAVRMCAVWWEPSPEGTAQGSFNRQGEP